MSRRAASRALTSLGFDRDVAPVRRGFFYLPFMHSEELALQELSLRLYEALAADPEFADQLRFARRHHEIIARFGRFPHRNAALGRVATPAEAAFLQEPESSF